MKLSRFALLALLVVGCRRETVEQGPDSVLTKPVAPIQPGRAVVVDSESNLRIDSSRMRPPEHTATLDRFSAMQVRDIYHDYKPLRKEGASEEARENFLAQKKITRAELRAILEEGDKLGWGSVK